MEHVQAVFLIIVMFLTLLNIIVALGLQLTD